MKIKVKVVPNSVKESIELFDDFLKVKLSAVPEKNKANIRLVEMLAKHFKVLKSKVRIVRGFSSKTKIVEIEKG